MIKKIDSTIVEYQNRYGDIFTFESNERGNIDWKGNFEFGRFGYNDNPNDITMVDPSGGPYITLGANMGLFASEFNSMVVCGFIWKEGYYEIVIDKS